MYEIEKSLWHTCKLCNKKISELARIHGGSNVYYSNVFYKHITLDHQSSLEEYFGKPPICKCGICNKESRVLYLRGKIKWLEYCCGRYPGQQKWSEEAKITRKGKGNPMYGGTPWNKGLDNTNEIIRRVSQARIGTKASDETKQKLREAYYRREVFPHTGHKHSEETKEKLRQNTLRMIKEGKFKQTKTKPHMELCRILKELNINFVEEYNLEGWSFDVYLTDFKVLIEADGDYFHSNPKIYPNGPKTKTQRVNWYRDIKKNEFCKVNQLELMRFWESDLINNQDSVKEKLSCFAKV